MDIIEKSLAVNPVVNEIYGIHDYKRLLACIIDSYDDFVVRSYSKIRFNIININILHILGLCLRGRRKILDIGCGFGLFGCYFSALFPEIEYVGIDINLRRIELARLAASRLGITNASFRVQDARNIELDEPMDAIMMIDLLHHLEDGSKVRLLEACSEHLAPDGRLIIKDVTTHPFIELAFTWALDVLMTRGFKMWYWDERKFYSVFANHFNRVDSFPISDWMPYPHIVYLAEKVPQLKEEA